MSLAKPRRLVEPAEKGPKATDDPSRLDATMDQIKEIIKQAIKYRFWIAIGLSALLPLIGYFVGVGPIKREATAKAEEVKGADSSVKKYANGTVPNSQYKTIVAGKTDLLTADVNAAWTKLYSRQAPLLTWPTPELQAKFNEWGRKWPTGLAPVAVQLTINDYMIAYPAQVTQVYSRFRPWDPINGTGVVQAAPKDVLLQPHPFDQNNPPSDLGLIWATQEKLWVQRALLEVINKVNKNAKGWDSATIKQIIDLQVANWQALDQVSMSKGETLMLEPSITKDGVVAAAPAATGVVMGGRSDMSELGGGASAGLSGAAAGPSSGGMSGGGSESITVSYLSSSNDQYKVVPVSMSVIIDQNSINNLLTELANSPMAIQVIDYEHQRPSSKISKPVKGESLDFGGAYAGSAGSRIGLFNMTASSYGGMQERMAAYGGGAAPISDMASAYGGRMNGGGGATTQRKGRDLRSIDKRSEQEEKKKQDEEAAKVTIHDPYYNLVLVTVYGQARFYNAPPVEAQAQPSTSEATAADSTEEAAQPKAEAETPKTDDSKPDDGAPKDETKPEAESP
jgi:hypothetical protein